MNIVLLGPPGAGKGTQGAKCLRKYQLTAIAPGDLLREHIKQGTDLGKQAASYINEGQLAPPELVMALVEDQLQAKKSSRGFLFDGFPRTIAQAALLEEKLLAHRKKLDGVIFLAVPEQEIKQRIKERAKTSGRADDQGEAKVATRMQVYYHETLPLVKYYEEQGKLFRVNGVGDIETIFRCMVAVMDRLQSDLSIA